MRTHIRLETGTIISQRRDILFKVLLAIATLVFLTSSLAAQSSSDPTSLPKNSFIWNQDQRELGFLHFDAVFNGREVSNGENARKLPQGAPIAAFVKGGEKEDILDDFLTEHKVAGLLVLHDGSIRLERYGLGLDETGRWTSQSVAKSVTSTLVGAAIKDGYIKSIEDNITDYIPDLKGSAYDSVTLRHLLTMTTGVKWNENYTDPNSDIVRYYSTPIETGMHESVSYMRRLPSEAEPGEKWSYKTGETNLLGVLVSSATGQTLSDYLSEKIWVPYGMEAKATWLLGRTDHELAGCCLQMKLRDAGRFGQFVLDGGQIDGEYVVPEDWFQTATSTHVQLFPGFGYGFQWWTSNNGTFKALGIHGQMIYIDPARRLVVVINSAWPEAESTQRHMATDHLLRMIAEQLDKE